MSMPMSPVTTRAGEIELTAGTIDYEDTGATVRSSCSCTG